MATFTYFTSEYPNDPEVREVQDIYEATYELCMLLDFIFGRETCRKILQRWMDGLFSANPESGEIIEAETTHEDEHGTYHWHYKKEG